MLHSIKAAFKNYLAQTQDIRNMDATSMTLHDCIRLVHGQQQFESVRSETRRDRQAAKMNSNLESPHKRFIASDYYSHDHAADTNGLCCGRGCETNLMESEK